MKPFTATILISLCGSVAVGAPMFELRAGNETSVDLSMDGAKDTFFRLEDETRPLDVRVEGPITLAVKFRVLSFGKASGRLDVERDGAGVSENHYDLERNFSLDLADTGTSAERVIHIEAPAGEHRLSLRPAYGLPMLVKVLRIPKSQQELLAQPEVSLADRQSRVAVVVPVTPEAPGIEVSRLQPAAQEFASVQEIPAAELPVAPVAPAPPPEVPAAPPAPPPLLEAAPAVVAVEPPRALPPVVAEPPKSGRLEVSAFVDTNGNGQRDAGETLLGGLEIRIVGPDLARTVELGSNGRAMVEWWSPGPYLVAPAGDLPGELVAGARATPIVQLREFGTTSIALALEAPRVVTGRVCLDRDRDGTCGEGEPGLGLVRLRAGDLVTVSALDGTFSLGQQPPGPVTVVLAEPDLRGGLALPAEGVTFAAGVNDGSVALSADPYTRREESTLVQWPGDGRVRARELGGYVFPGDGLRRVKVEKGKRGKKDVVETSLGAEEQSVLRTLVKGKRKGAKLFVTVSRSPELSGDEAETDAATIAENLAKWMRAELDLDVNDFVPSTGEPASSEALVSVRVLAPVQ